MGLERIEPLDWRYSAAIVGLKEYLTWVGASNWKLQDEYLEYNPESITESDYLKFVEQKYSDDMHHVLAEELLLEEEPSEEQIKLINEKLTANTVLKKIFGKIKYDGTNREQIQELIEENREEIVKETYRNKVNLYRNYCNTNQLFEPGKNCCRLLGYYVDLPKKGKSISYNFDMANFVYEDTPIFDFIPFAFCGERDFYFINDNVDLRELVKTNKILQEKIKKARENARQEGKTIDSRQIFFQTIIESKDFMYHDIEIIHKNVEKTHFETLYLSKKSLDILQKLNGEKTDKKRYKAFCFKIKINDNYYLDVFKETMNCIVNLILTDEWINYLLKNNANGNYTYVLYQLIKVNLWIKEDADMEAGNKRAYGCAKAVAKKKDKVPDNKLISFRQKLTSALTFEDYDRFCDILLNLSNYADEPFDFAYDLFEDFEKNKELAYTFVTALRRDNKNVEETKV